MSGIFYSTRAIAGREGKGIMNQLKILESNDSSVDLLTNTKTNANKNIIKEHAKLHVKNSLNLFGEFYLTKALKMSSWMEIYDSLDVSSLKEYKNLYLIGGIDLWRSNLTRKSKRVGVFPNDSGQIKFQSTGSHCVNILALLKAHRTYDIPLHELAFDPNEMSVDLFHEDVKPTEKYNLYHGYDIPAYNIKRLDSFQYYLNNKNSIFDSNYSEKQFDFTYGYTVLQKSDRNKYIKFVNDVSSKFEKTNIYVRNDVTGENTLVDRDVYLDKIGLSKYTIMLPSYDTHCFSIYRFIESLYHDCLPLLHSDNNIEDVQKSYDVDLKMLITDKMFSEKERLELLNYLKEKFMKVRKGFINYD